MVQTTVSFDLENEPEVWRDFRSRGLVYDGTFSAFVRRSVAERIERLRKEGN